MRKFIISSLKSLVKTTLINCIILDKSTSLIPRQLKKIINFYMGKFMLRQKSKHFFFKASSAFVILQC